MEKIIKEKVCCWCKTNSLYVIKNQRADASFEYFVHCNKCRKWVGEIDWDGKFNFLKNKEMKKITAADLLRLGFERVDVLEEESGDKDYYYFTFNIETTRVYPILITGDDDNESDIYTVEINELDDAVVIKDVDDLESLIDIIKRNVNNE